MTKEEAAALMPDVQHHYWNVTALEAVNCPVNKFLTEIGGKTLLGTNTPVQAIAAKELVE